MTSAAFGDDELAAWADERLHPQHDVMAAATVSTGAATVTSRGADLDADFEIASISKGITGLLYADAMERGEVEGEATLGEFLPLNDAPVAAVTLDALSTHRSGLPSLPPAAHPLRRSFALWRHGTNPYGESLDQLLEQARGVVVGAPRPRYSNLGFELLGHAVASAAGMPFADLVQSRLAVPLGLSGLYAPATVDQLRPGALTGRSRRGKPREP